MKHERFEFYNDKLRDGTLNGETAITEQPNGRAVLASHGHAGRSDEVWDR